MTQHNQPNMPTAEAMTAAELTVMREFLGLTGDWLAEHLGVSPRTVRHWEAGKYAIPDGVKKEIESLKHRTNQYISKVTDELTDVTDPVLASYRTDKDYHAAHPDMRLPARWYRAVLARVAQEIPTLTIVYRDRIN
jgi:DNA-binding transcriptional regulator YiaG